MSAPRVIGPQLRVESGPTKPTKNPLCGGSNLLSRGTKQFRGV